MTVKGKLELHKEIEESNKQKENEWKKGKVKMKKAVLIRTNGEIKMIDFPEDDVMSWSYKQIGCDIVECVRPKGLPEGVVMIVDEEGLLVDKPILNVVPSYLYGTLEHGHPICGNVIIAKEEWGDDGYVFAGMDEDEAFVWEKKFRNIQPLADLLFALHE